MGINVPWPPASSQEPTQSIRLPCTHTSWATTEGPCPLPTGTDIAVGPAKGHMIHRLKHNKGAHTEPGTEKDFSIQGDRCTQAVNILSPYWRVSGPWPILISLRGSQKLLAFPTVSLEFCLFHIFTLALKVEYNPQRGL